MIIVCQITALSQFKRDVQSPTVTISDEAGKKSALRMSELHVDVKVVGNLATTTMEMTFFNDLNRILEGELNFPLAEGQVISRFAMDMNGKLREGVVVEKAKGRQVFEEVVRTKIDPALLEQTKGNSFKSRVYPIPAMGSKKIVIAYENELQNDEEGMTYLLPMQFKDILENFSLTVQVFSPEKPNIEKNAIPGINFERDANYFGAEVHYKNYTADKQFEFSLPSGNLQNQVFTETINGKTYFYLNMQPQVFNDIKVLPKKICLLWDVSTSAAIRDFDREINVLDQYFKKIGNCSIELVPFSNAVHESEFYQVIDGNWEDLQDKIKALPLDGGTQLGCLQLSKYQCDEFILCSDGIGNFGEKEIKLSDKPVYILSSSQTADHSYLKYVAQKTGGQFINLLNMTDDKAANALINSTYSFISAVYSPGLIAETYPSISTPIRSSFTFSGILLSDKAEIQLNFGTAGKILHTETIVIDSRQHDIKSGMLSRMWASKKLSELDMRYESNKDEITQLGKDFSIVTRNTSLIILDRIEDYVRFKIVPPEELQKEYYARLDQIKNTIRNEDSTHSAYVSGLFNGRKDWWNRDYDYLSLNKYESPSDNTNNVQRLNPVISREDSIRNAQSQYWKSICDTTTGDIISSNNPVSWGAIKGRITDDSTKEPIPGATIMVKGTKLGAIADRQGNNTVINIPPGHYDIRVSAIGYAQKIFNVQVEANTITRKNFVLKEEGITTSAVLCVSDPLVPNTTIGDQTTVNSSELQSVAREGITSILALTPGVNSSGEGIVIRGSRGEETQVRVDGLDVSNLLGDNIKFFNMSTIGLKEWSCKAPYLKILNDTSEIDKYQVYLGLRKVYGSVSGFYLDVADYFAERQHPTLALRILSNLAEMEMENHQLMRILAYRLEQLGNYDLAVLVFREVLKIREEEPQSYRDLGLALALAGNYQEAADQLYHVVSYNWHGRFPEVEIIALNELNNLISKYPGKINTNKFDSKLIENLPVDVRFVLNWDADNCDMDLWVTDPRGEKCYYGHNATQIGGRISKDFTQGYGPEEFIIKNAMPGKYKIQVNYYGSRQQNIHGPTTIMMETYTNYGKPDEKRQDITLRLKDVKEIVDVGEVEVR
jgi:hypothetical protein